MCIIGHYVEVIVACVMFVIVLRRIVECLYYPCTHAHTQKKKLYLLCEAGCRDEWEVCYSASLVCQNILKDQDLEAYLECGFF